MKAEPLKKEIYNKAKELGIENIILRFSGGSDEGYLDIELMPYEKHNQEFANEIEEWAWEVYSYSGAGEGNDYGDNIEYDLKAGKVSTSEWYTSISNVDAYSSNLQIEA
jgi:uncharacterized protein involved in high-affinity Fe2+ transport